MKAAIRKKCGPPEVVTIQDIPKPAPKADEILVRVRATTICAADWRLRKADPWFIRLMGMKRVLGMEFSGVVEAVGAHVTRFKPGDAVYGATGFDFGAHAEYLVMKERGPVGLKPANLSFDEAAAVMFGAVTALHFLRNCEVRQGESVLIYGASGSVGVFTVQFAKIMGARVTGVCSTANLELVRALGAETVYDYTREDYARDGAVQGVVIDTVGKSGFARARRALKKGGRFAQIGLASLSDTLAWTWASITGGAKTVGGVAGSGAEDIAYLSGLLESGALRTVIDRRYPLAEIVDAYRYVETGRKKGHVVITMPEG